MQEVFRAADADGNGTLTAEELMAWLKDHPTVQISRSMRTAGAVADIRGLLRSYPTRAFSLRDFCLALDAEDAAARHQPPEPEETPVTPEMHRARVAARMAATHAEVVLRRSVEKEALRRVEAGEAAAQPAALPTLQARPPEGPASDSSAAKRALFPHAPTAAGDGSRDPRAPDLLRRDQGQSSRAAAGRSGGGGSGSPSQMHGVQGRKRVLVGRGVREERVGAWGSTPAQGTAPPVPHLGQTDAARPPRAMQPALAAQQNAEAGAAAPALRVAPVASAASGAVALPPKPKDSGGGGGAPGGGGTRTVPGARGQTAGTMESLESFERKLSGRLKKLFRLADSNGDGRVTRAELGSMLESKKEFLRTIPCWSARFLLDEHL